MCNFRGLLRLPISLLLCSTVLPVVLSASPSIDVTLQASFPAPPFIVELLETAATENSTSYLPLLDAVAAGHFSSASTDSHLYSQFLEVLQQDGHITDPAALASFKLALAVHEAAPRIEAQYQFWRSTGERQGNVQKTEHSWTAVEVWREDGRLCADSRCKGMKDVETEDAKWSSNPTSEPHTKRSLQFDRVHGNGAAQDVWTLYIDPTSSHFSRIYSEWRQANPIADVSFRIRYKPPMEVMDNRLVVNGYGVELALKRTDYIVIDDRQAEESHKNEDAGAAEVNLEEQDIADLKPLSSSELLNLGIKASSFIMASEDPLDTLVKVSQDFPKYAAPLALHETSHEFVLEHTANREKMLPPGYNVIWINGMQVSPREMDVFSLLERLRRERKLVNGIQEIGFSASEAINILSHPEIAGTQSGAEPERYDFRDDTEGGNIILWLNDIEMDKRYATWPEDIFSLLQRTYPGQLPAVRKDIQNIIFPINLIRKQDTVMVVDTLRNLVKRQIAARFGIVPSASTPTAIAQAKLVYYLNEAYGLTSVMTYLEKCLDQMKVMGPNQAAFEAAISNRKLRRDTISLSYSEVLSSDSFDSRIAGAKEYLARLGADGSNPPFFANGVPIPNNDEWLQTMSTRISADLRVIQQGVFEERYTQDMWLPSVFLEKANLRRNALVVPDDETDVKLFDVGNLFADYQEEMQAMTLEEQTDRVPGKASLIAIMDMNSKLGSELLLSAIEFMIEHEDVDVAFKHQSTLAEGTGFSSEGVNAVKDILQNTRPDLPDSTKERIESVLKALQQTQSSVEGPALSPFVGALGLSLGQQGLLLNGRLIIIPPTVTFTKDDLSTFLSYEWKKRIGPTVAAVEALGLSEKVGNSQVLARLSSLVAISTISDVPEGIYDASPGARMNAFDVWQDSITCIKTGDIHNASLQVVASIDPTSEVAQRWIPILRILSRLEGVHMRLFVNPKEMLQELPVKRFYRQVLSEQPLFAADGKLEGLTARFAGIPEEALLTMTMDTPPSWLVAPKESVYDLDNIKLSSVKGQGNVAATYELEYILIEGHSRDVTAGSPPRGAQLVLQTEDDAKFADTIIMANLGYFQFKANPGVYNLALQEGRSQEIFNIDSAGNQGYGVQAGDNTTEISLVSFQGATVYPRLSRKPGKLMADVLETPPISAEAVVSKIDEVADKVLSKIGLSGGYLAKGLQWGQNILAKAGHGTVTPSKKHADINIFSVASGHLYERMLNIMMVSVMRHTKHTVKFWFIEQFLSPSFKSFLPTVAAAYNFEYEMVTYKWPHWLRAQTEKQRVIWGYKILFLDVLFPLDLDKVIFVDADQIVRTDMYELVTHDLEGAPYGFTPMCDSRTEMEGFRFWKQGYWKTFLRGLPYHISALYVVDLKRFRQIAAGDRLRGQYHQLSADPNSLSNLDQDLPNHMQMVLPIHSLPQEWLWCETWCSDESLKEARTIDLCNNPLTKEPKLDRARRQVPEWTVYDDEIAELAKRKSGEGIDDGVRVVAAEGKGVGTEQDAEVTRDEVKHPDLKRDEL